MADPFLDEDFIRSLLSVPVNAAHTEELQAGAVQALIDLYDRKVTREEYCNMAAACVTLYGQCSKWWMLHNVKRNFDAGDLTTLAFTKADEQFEHLIRKQAEVVVEVVKRLQLCPTSKDPVH